MALIKSLPNEAHLSDVFKKFPNGVKQLLEYHDIILREESCLSVGERELIAAYVSGLNGCQFCFGAHVSIASHYGVDPGLFVDLIADVDSSDVEARFKPLLKYVKKLTQTPTQLVESDAQTIYDAGWSEKALFSAISVCSLFNFMNRLVEGTGVSVASRKGKTPSDSYKNNTSAYQNFGRSIGII